MYCIIYFYAYDRVNLRSLAITSIIMDIWRLFTHNFGVI
jgi:hypothetical protein